MQRESYVTRPVGIAALILALSLLAVAFGTPLSAHAQGLADLQPATTYAAFQPFEGGYLIWREDTGDIWALLTEGYSVGWFAESGYANLPDNPVTDEPPPGLVRPVSGFGRVWGNHETIRYRLGWALTPETGYTLTISPPTYTAGGFAQHAINLPNGEALVVRADGTWGRVGEARPIASLPAVTQFGAAVQRFAGGLLLYWSETGSIWALTYDGRAQLIDSWLYGRLPENPITTTPPAGRVRPILGFGKVWGHFADLRATLGWALEPETGYLMHFERQVQPGSVGSARVSFLVTLDNGRTIAIRDNGTWAAL